MTIMEGPPMPREDPEDTEEVEARKSECRRNAFENLLRFVELSGGSRSLLDGWWTSAEMRKQGDTVGHLDVRAFGI